MTKRIIVIVTGALLGMGSVVAQAGPPWAPPGWQNSAPDPCRNCQVPSKIQLPDNRVPDRGEQRTVTPPPPPNPNHDPDVQRGIDTYKKPGS
jgi:hypothetical protein